MFIFKELQVEMHEIKLSAHLFFCKVVKFFLKAGLIWLSSSTREWLRKLGLAGLGLKLYVVDLNKKHYHYMPYQTAKGGVKGRKKNII